MSKRSEKKKTTEKRGLVSRLIESFGERGQSMFVRSLLSLAVFVCAAGVIVYVLRQLEVYVEARGPEDPDVRLTLRGVPKAYRGRPAQEILADAREVASVGWADDRLVEDIGVNISKVGWIKRVRRVEKLFDGRVLIDCDYRTPAALVEHDTKYYLVDGEGVRLPGQYVNDPRYRLIAGVAVAPPETGQPWEGQDLQAGLALLDRLAGEPFWDQISAVSVHNFRGRTDPRGVQIELVTTSPGPGRVAGRIRWGSALGDEIEEPTPEEKVATLRANYARYRRIDCNQMWIDVSTRGGSYLYPDSTSAMKAQ